LKKEDGAKNIHIKANIPSMTLMEEAKRGIITEETKEVAEAEKIDEEIFMFISRATKKADKIINEQKNKIEKVVMELLKNETIEKEKFEELVKN